MSGTETAGRDSDGGMTGPPRVFCSYAHEDIEFVRELKTMCAGLEKRGIIGFWHDEAIPPGADWDKTIKDELDKADLLVFLYSKHFEASDYCWSVEVKTAEERRDTEGVGIFVVVVRPVVEAAARFTAVQMLPKKDGLLTPVVSWDLHDDAYKLVAEEIARFARERAATAGDRAPGTDRLWGVPAKTPGLVGRDDLLRDMREAFRSGGERPIVALVGVGGVGKTSAAVEYVCQHREEYDFVAWLKAERATRLLSDYAALADRVGLETTDDQFANRSLFRKWLEENDRWLLIFDNAVDVDVVDRLLPQRTKGHALVTSREHIWSSISTELTVGPLSLDDAIGYLLSQAQIPDLGGARELATELGGVPLALENAVATIQAERLTFSDYLERLRAREA